MQSQVRDTSILVMMVMKIVMMTMMMVMMMVMTMVMKRWVDRVDRQLVRMGYRFLVRGCKGL